MGEQPRVERSDVAGDELVAVPAAELCTGVSTPARSGTTSGSEGQRYSTAGRWPEPPACEQDAVGTRSHSLARCEFVPLPGGYLLRSCTRSGRPYLMSTITQQTTAPRCDLGLLQSMIHCSISLDCD